MAPWLNICTNVDTKLKSAVFNFEVFYEVYIEVSTYFKNREKLSISASLLHKSGLLIFVWSGFIVSCCPLPGCFFLFLSPWSSKSSIFTLLRIFSSFLRVKRDLLSSPLLSRFPEKAVITQGSIRFTWTCNCLYLLKKSKATFSNTTEESKYKDLIEIMKNVCFF